MRCICGEDGKFRCAGFGIVDIVIIRHLSIKQEIPFACKEMPNHFGVVKIEEVSIKEGVVVLKVMKSKEEKEAKEVRVLEVYI